MDKNTLSRERGKYAYICIQVDMTKSILAMFLIKGKNYNVEYEGLQTICLYCERFGHYAKSYRKRNRIGLEIVNKEIWGGKDKGKEKEVSRPENAGSWTIIHKPQEIKKKQSDN